MSVEKRRRPPTPVSLFSLARSLFLASLSLSLSRTCRAPRSSRERSRRGGSTRWPAWRLRSSRSGTRPSRGRASQRGFRRCAAPRRGGGRRRRPPSSRGPTCEGRCTFFVFVFFRERAWGEIRERCEKIRVEWEELWWEKKMKLTGRAAGLPRKQKPPSRPRPPRRTTSRPRPLRP